MCGVGLGRLVVVCARELMYAFCASLRHSRFNLSELSMRAHGGMSCTCTCSLVDTHTRAHAPHVCLTCTHTDRRAIRLHTCHMCAHAYTRIHACRPSHTRIFMRGHVLTCAHATTRPHTRAHVGVHVHTLSGTHVHTYMFRLNAATRAGNVLRCVIVVSCCMAQRIRFCFDGGLFPFFAARVAM